LLWHLELLGVSAQVLVLVPLQWYQGLLLWLLVRFRQVVV
jgi:type IV secretory pathway TrbD component